MQMKGFGSSATVCAALLVGTAGAALAADYDVMPTKAPLLTKAPPPLSAPAACTGIQDFFLTACQLSWYGVRFYGTIDVGYGYQTHGAPWDPFFTPGASYFLQKMNRSPIWTLSPNGLSQSNLGIQVKEPLCLGWSLVGQLEPGDLKSKLVIGGFVDHPYGPEKQRCMECMYYLVHRRWCDLPELAVPVEPDWWCRLWRI